MKIFFLIAAGLVLSGCLSARLTDEENGRVVSSTDVDIGPFSAEARTATYERLYNDCVSQVGSMPGGEEVPLCVQKTRQDMRRNGAALDLAADPYRYYYYPYSR